MFYRGFTVEDGKAEIELNIPCAGDITIMVYHARSTFGGKVQGKVCIGEKEKHMYSKMCLFNFTSISWIYHL